MPLTRIRIHQLAKELDRNSKDILSHCQRLGFAVSSVNNSLTGEQANRVRSQFLKGGLFPELSEALLSADNNSVPGLEIPEHLWSAKYYFNREISWLWFNDRVLHEAFDPRTPLIEQLKFLAIFSSNLDEYFMVRVAGLKQQVAAGVLQRSRDGLTPQEQLAAIHEQLKPQVIRQHRFFDQDMRRSLAEVGIQVLNTQDLTPPQATYVLQFFRTQIFPVLTPLAVDPSHPFPYISNLSLNLAVVIVDRETGEQHFARIKVPDKLPRFVQIPKPEGEEVGAEEKAIHWCGLPIEQVIALYLGDLFPGMEIQGCYPFRITRNADIELEEDEADDLLLAIEEELRKRRFGSVVRLEIQVGMPDPIRQSLMSDLALQETDVYALEGMLKLDDLFSFDQLPLPEFKFAPWAPAVPERLQRLDGIAGRAAPGLVIAEPNGKVREEALDFFAIIRARDMLVHHPYDSFALSVQRFIEEAAQDPDVLTIKMTLYRTSGEGMGVSPIVAALMAAAENGKQVVVLVELKARFDEANNILWARRLEEVGVHVVYGLVGLKTHTKIALVVRQESAKIRRYCHIGTGNYNPKTARLYTDLGLFTCEEEIGADLTDLFNYLTGYSRQQTYRKIVVAPHSLRNHLLGLIQQEIDYHQQGHPGRIIAKMNSLIDSKLIAALYVASQAGVEIDLIIRGICSLKPGIKGVSETIRVISIIGRFLEHDRVFFFEHGGEPKLFMGSADWRPRNLDRRVEAMVPIEDFKTATYLRGLLDLYLSDNRQAWELQSAGDYIQRQPKPEEPECSTHQMLMQLAQQRSPQLSL
jgi:polyphosphate kinase